MAFRVSVHTGLGISRGRGTLRWRIIIVMTVTTHIYCITFIALAIGLVVYFVQNTAEQNYLNPHFVVHQSGPFARCEKDRESPSEFRSKTLMFNFATMTLTSKHKQEQFESYLEHFSRLSKSQSPSLYLKPSRFLKQFRGINIPSQKLQMYAPLFVFPPFYNARNAEFSIQCCADEVPFL